MDFKVNISFCLPFIDTKLTLKTVVLNQGTIFVTYLGHLAMSGGIFGCHSGAGTFLLAWVEVENAGKHPTMHRAALHNNKNAKMWVM